VSPARGGDLPACILPDHLPIICARPDRVTIWTDPAGACPIYTVRSDDGALTWGSSSRALASLSRAEVDEAWLAAFLADPYAETAGSVFSGVALVPPGTRLVLADGQVKELTQVWTRTPRRWSDAVDQLRSTLDASVRVRMTGVVAADLSGGMDSTTLAVFAARHCAVNAVTAHPAGVTAGGDLDHARVTAAAHPMMRHVLMPLTGDHLPYRGLDTLPPTDEPAPSTVTWAMLSAQFELLADIGVTCHLTGDGGDTLFLSPPVYLADLARRGRWLRLAADAQGWARLRRTSPWPLIGQAIRGRSPSTAAAAPRWLTPHAVRLADRGHFRRTGRRRPVRRRPVGRRRRNSSPRPSTPSPAWSPTSPPGLTW
jgi:asparagine synthase (glutamine-hydrolysing)